MTAAGFVTDSLSLGESKFMVRERGGRGEEGGRKGEESRGGGDVRRERVNGWEMGREKE